MFHDVGQAGREAEVLRLRRALPKLSDAQVLIEQFSVREVEGARPDIQGGVLVLDELTFERAGVVAFTIGQSAAMEYYERIVDQMFTETDRLVERLEKTGTISVFTRKLHKFIGAAIGTRNEVFSVLHLFDKPDAAWDDPDAEKVYEELRTDAEDSISSTATSRSSPSSCCRRAGRASSLRDRHRARQTPRRPRRISVVVLIAFEIVCCASSGHQSGR